MLAALVLLGLVALGAAVAGAVTPVSPSGSCLGKPATISGSGGGDVLTGTAGADVIVARGGADRIEARGGDDLICAGSGPDLARGGGGEDRLRGQGGQDRLFGEGGDDDLAGGANRDLCRGGAGRNTIFSCESGDKLPAPVPLPEPVKPTPSPPSRPASAPVDVAPTAVGDQASFTEGEAERAIVVTANDTDPDGGPRSIVSITQPEHGTATIAPDGLRVLYAPESDYCNDGEAADVFTYTLNGGSSATVSVSVACLTRIASSPALSPAFDPAVSDYTVECDSSPLTVSGRLAAGSTVFVDGGAAETGSFEAEVPLQPEQAFSFSVDDGVELSDYHVRCLPADFPTWEFERLGTPIYGFYMAAPALLPNVAPPYAVIFDANGVPVWWYDETPAPIDAKFLAADRVAWWSQIGAGDGYEIRDLDGNVVDTVSIVGGSTDIHELQQQPNGNYLVTEYQPHDHVDLTAFGGGADDSIIDGVIQEIDADGNVVWAWDSENHIDLQETGRWWPQELAKTGARDVVHMNAVEPVGNDAVLISMRHNDAVYKVDKATGNVVWKLGGTWTPKSLAVKNDPQGAYPLGGQHDVRLQPDGTITIYDNRTGLPGSPRAVRYAIDEGAKTATLVEEVTDPLVTSSFCCGSSRRSADGSWLFSWGGQSLVTEFDAAGQRTFKLGFGGADFSYRAVSAPAGLTAVALRTGMDSMHPRP